MRALRVSLFVCVGLLFLSALSAPELTYANAAEPVTVATEAVAVKPVEQSIVGSVLESVPTWLQVVSLFISAFAAIAALTPTPKDDGILLLLRKIIDFAALNFGGAKNAVRSKNNSGFS